MEERDAIAMIAHAEEALTGTKSAGRPNRPLQGNSVGDGVACRESGRSVLLSRARRLRQEAEALEALARAIPDNFPRDADEALWTLAITR